MKNLSKKLYILTIAAILASNLLISSLAFACNPVINCYEVELSAVEYHTNNTSTWFYSVSKKEGCEGPALSHWLWQPCFSLEELEDIFVSATPEPYTIGVDGSTGYYGIKWEIPEGACWDSPKTFSITIEGHPEEADINTTAVVKPGQNYFDLSVNGPSCGPEPYCELVLTKTDNVDPVNPGDELIYHLTLENTGTADCTGGGVRIKDEFDSNTDYVSSSKTPEAITDTYIKWNFGTLTPGEIEELDLTMLVSEEAECGSILINKAKYWSNQTCWGSYVIEETTIECPPEPFCGDGNLDPGEECEIGYECGCGYTCNIETCLCEQLPPEPYCGDGIINGDEECEADIDCDDQDETTADTCNACVCENTPLPECEIDEDCDDGYACNGLETCVDNQCVQGTPVDCSGNNISGIDTCDNIPDDNPFTRDFRFEFISVCEEPSGTCSTGDDTIDHTCDVGCGGCESDLDCDDQDGNTTDTCNLDTCICEHTPIEQPVCGDGVLDSGEECDDGNTEDGDGCSATCTIEQTPEPVCGNEITEEGEQCDNGTSNGQACSPSCESTCTYCSSDCTLVDVTGGSCGGGGGGGGGGGVTRYCGDGLLHPNRGEECDDGNKVDGDGCSSNCKIEEVLGETTPEPEEEPEEEQETEILGGRIELPDTGNSPLIYILIGISLIFIAGLITRKYFIPRTVIIDF